MSAEESASIDSILTAVGNWNTYQHRRFAMCCFLCIPAGTMVLINVFVIATPAHRCRIPLYDGNSSTVSYKLPNELLNLAAPLQNSSNDNNLNHTQCFMYRKIPHTGPAVQLPGSAVSLSDEELVAKGIEPCTHGYVYDGSVYGRTFTQQHDLVCAKAALAQLPQTLYFIGILLGSFTGWAADKFGRRPALLASLAGLLVFCGAASAAPDLITFTISRIVVAALETAVYLTTFVYMMELVGENKRAFVASGFQMFFPFGEIIAAAVAAAKLPWWLYNAVVSAPSIVGLILVYFLMDESVRWLTTTERFDKAEVVLNKIARSNKRPIVNSRVFQQFCVTQKQLHARTVDSSGNEPLTRAASKLDIFRYANMRINFCIQVFAWFVSSLVFYGLSMNISSLGGNPYVDSILLSLVEIPAYCLEWFGLDRFGRRFMISMALFVAGAANVLIAIVPFENAEWNWVIVVLALFGKLFIAVSFAIVYVHASELFPTYARTFAVGCSGVVSRLGGMLASEISLLGRMWHAGPFLLFGIGGLVAAAAYLALPETTGLTLPETAKEAEKLKRGNYAFPFRNWRKSKA